MINPILIDIPIPIFTPRLFLRSPQAGDGKQLNKAVIESLSELEQWMPWANHAPKLEDSELFARQAEAKWILREDLTIYIFDKTGQILLGGTGLHRMDWSIPKFEIGYWIRSSYANQGIITESTNALTRYAFKQLHAKRVEIKCDENNIASRKVAEKLNFNCEAIHYQNALRPNGQIRNTVIYARYDTSNLPELEVRW